MPNRYSQGRLCLFLQVTTNRSEPTLLMLQYDQKYQKDAEITTWWRRSWLTVAHFVLVTHYGPKLVSLVSVDNICSLFE